MVKFQVLITVILSVLTLILLLKQYRLQQYRIKMDLFEKRFKVYSHVRKFILTGSKEGGTKLEIVQNFLSDIPEYEFIFDKDGEIVKYIDDLWRKGLDYSHLQEDVNNLHSFPVGSLERDELINKKRPYVEFFTHEFDYVKHRFSKYLQLGEVEEGKFLSKSYQTFTRTKNYFIRRLRRK